MSDRDKEPLLTVADYITDARRLLLDQIEPFRYPDDDLITAFNLALLEGRRLRPDLFVYRNNEKVPYYGINDGEEVPMERQFRMSFVYGLVAHALLRDEEDVQDDRANSFMTLFQSLLTGIKMTPITGGTPGAPQQRRG